MKSLTRFAAAMLAAIFCLLVPAQATMFTPLERSSKAASCGVERIEIKTLTDPTAGSVQMTPVQTTVENLRIIPIPPGYNRYDDSFRYPAELHVYTVTAQIIGFKHESDRDFHIVIASPDNAAQTMIAEPPDPNCPLSQKSGHAAQFEAVRDTMVRCFGEPTTYFRRLSGHPIAVLTGVGYFDPLHGQTGVAPNGIELHPLLSLTVLSGCFAP